MPTHSFRSIARLFRPLAVLVLTAGVIGLAPLPQHVLASPPAVPAKAPALGLLPSPVPTINVGTTSIADNPADGQCDLWEAMQAAFLADFDGTPTYHECTAALGGTNVIAFIGLAAGGTIQISDTVHGGDLPFAWGDLTLLGPITIEPSPGLTDTHMFRTSGDANFTLIGVTLTGAHTGGSGAAILDLNHATINIIGSNVAGNTADNSGGAIDSNGNVNVSLSNFSGNIATGANAGVGAGGAIWVSGAGNLTIAKSNFAGNVAKGAGGAIYSTSASATIEDSLFSGNVAGQAQNLNKGGGAVYNDVGGALGIARTQFAGNLAPQGNGGAIYNNAGATLVLSDTTFAANLAGDFSHIQYGGAIYDQASLTVQRSSFVNNISVEGHGGALAVDSAGTADVANTTFAANGAPNGLGAAVIVTQTQAGGPSSTFNARNVTISKNGTPAGSDSGLYNALGQNVSLGNTIIAGNINANCAGPGNYNSAGHSLDDDSTCHLNGPGDLPGNPNANLGGPSFNGGPISSMLTMKLQFASSAIDNGDNAICATAPVNNEDQRGDKRPKDGSGPTNQSLICDIGAYEADAPKPGYGSAPSEPGPIDVGSVQQGHTVMTTLVVSNTGDFLLTITPHALVGSGDFSVSQSIINIAKGGPPVNIVISCTPSSTGARTAFMAMATTDVPLHALVGYKLNCTGNAVPVAGFNSAPIPPGPITLPDTQFGLTTTRTIKVSEIGDAQLQVSSGGLGGADPQDFSVSGATFNINDGGAAHNITVRCTPTDYGLRTATLTLNTNDATQSQVVYNLSCKGIPQPSPYLASGTSALNTPTDHGLNGVYGVAVSPDSHNVYATSYTDGKLSAFSRDAATGTLTFITSVHDSFLGSLDQAHLMAVSPDGKNGYVAAAAHGNIDTFTFNGAYGPLTFTDVDATPDLGGAYGVAVSPDGRNVYGTGSSANSVVAFTRHPSGTLDFLASVISAANMGGAVGLTVSPDGQNVYVAAHSSNSLEILTRNGVSGALSHLQTRKQGDTLDGPALVGLTGARQVVVSPDGANVYVTGDNNAAVVAFSRSPIDGSLTWLSTYTNGSGGISGLTSVSGIDVTPDGLQVITASYTDIAVVVFDRDPGTGLLTFRQVRSKASHGLPLDGARVLRISPDGNTAYVSAFNDDAIAVLPVANPVPLLTNLSPASAVQGGPGFKLHIYGANFVPGVTAFFGADQPAVTYLNPNQIDVSISAAEIAGAPGVRQVQIQNPDPSAVGGNFSFPVPFHITAPASNPVPSISSITPQGALAGGLTQTLQIYGANFINGSTVQWNGSNRATTFIDGGHVQATIPQTLVAQSGAYAVTVVTGVPGGGTSNAAQFSVAQPGQNAVPTLTGLNPTWAYSFGALSKQIHLAVTGTGHNFIEGSTVQLDGANRPTQFVDDNHLIVTITGSDLISPASVGIAVFTPKPGGGASNTLTFTIRKWFPSYIPLVRK